MAKKLKVELEVDSSKAKSQVQRDMSGIDVGGGSGLSTANGPGAAADRLSKSLDNAAKKSGDFAGSAEVLSAKTRAVVGAFAGMGVSMAMSFASQNMKRGGARDAVEIAAGTLQGAAMGGMAGGPWGAVAGGVLGLGMGLWNKSQEKERYKEGWSKSEHDYKNDKEFADLIENLTDVSDKTADFADKLKTVEEELEKYRQIEDKLKSNVEGMIKSGRYDDADAQRGYLAVNRQRQEQLEAAKKQLEAAADKGEEKTLEAASMGGVDALTKVGGILGVPPPGAESEADAASTAPSSAKRQGRSFGFFVPKTPVQTHEFSSRMEGLESSHESAVRVANEHIEKLEEEGNKILKEIAANTKAKGGATWQ